MEFILRKWEKTDLESLVQYANNRNVAKNMTDKFSFPYTEADGISFIEFANKKVPDSILAIVVNGIAVGSIGIHPQEDIMRKNAELGYWIGEPYWGRGIVTSAVKQVIGFAFTTYDINRIFARPFGTNTASQKVLEKAGFRLEGRFEKTIFKNGEYFDELVYAIRR